MKVRYSLRVERESRHYVNLILSVVRLSERTDNLSNFMKEF